MNASQLRLPAVLLLPCLLICSAGCNGSATADESPQDSANQASPANSSSGEAAHAEGEDAVKDDAAELETATLGGGCFWCTEAVFARLKGVDSVVSGYMGGSVEDPTYQAVCTGLTGHAEVIQVKYDPKVVSFDLLLEVFWKTHDPTTLNRQGNDVGTQYRSVVFYHSDQQKKLAEDYKRKLNDANAFGSPIVTEISPAVKFYEAEKYHQDYYAQNPNQGYCRAIIPPKLNKLEKIFGDKLKESASK